MNIFVTGHEGFLGRHLTAELERRGHQVATTNQVLDGRSVEEVFTSRLDAIVHLAATTPQSGDVQVTLGYEADQKLMEELVRRCSEESTRLVFASTSGVYQQSDLPLCETAAITLENAYSRAKLACENSVLAAVDAGELEAIVLRLFNPYGPGQRRTFFIPYVLQQALNDEAVNIENPTNVRDYVFVSDVTEAFIRAIEFPSESFDHLDVAPVFNVGSALGTSGYQLIDAVQSALQYDLKVLLPEKQPPGNTYVADCNRIKRYLNFQAKVRLADGLRKTLETLR